MWWQSNNYYCGLRVTPIYVRQRFEHFIFRKASLPNEELIVCHVYALIVGLSSPIFKYVVGEEILKGTLNKKNNSNLHIISKNVNNLVNFNCFSLASRHTPLSVRVSFLVAYDCEFVC